jgi:hypothetical protein
VPWLFLSLLFSLLLLAKRLAARPFLGASDLVVAVVCLSRMCQSRTSLTTTVFPTEKRHQIIP